LEKIKIRDTSETSTLQHSYGQLPMQIISTLPHRLVYA